MPDGVNIDLAAAMAANQRGFANYDSQTSNQARILDNNEMTAAGWRGSASRAYQGRSLENDQVMTTNGQDAHRIEEANQQSIMLNRSADEDNMTMFMFGAVNP